MKIIFYQDGDQKIAEIKSSSALIQSTNDALDLIVDPDLDDARKIILYKENFAPDFYELRTGLAGEIIQKLVNYQIQWAIVGDFNNIASKSLKAFILECNRGNCIYFANDLESAKKALFSA